MTTKARKGALIAAVAAIAPGAGWGLPDPADARDAAAQRQQQGTTDDADSVELYTRAVDVDVAEARRRLAAQGDLNTALTELRALAGDRFAGSWIEHQPDYRGVVRLTGPVADRAAFDAAVAASPVPIDVRTDAPMSLAELQVEQARVQEELGQALPGAMTGIHEQSGSINVYVPGTGQASRREADAALPEVREATDAPLRVRYDQGEMSVQHDYGGDRITGCTSGFTVFHAPSNQDGILSAGHCGDSRSYEGYNGDVYPLTRAAAKWDATVDMAVYTSSHVTVPGEFYVSPTTRLTLTSVMPWQYQLVGDFVCHYGRTSGNSCGFITDRAGTICDTEPLGVDNPPCQPNWVRVESRSTLMCLPGDSGGPWYVHIDGVDVSAWGIHHGGWFVEPGTNPGNCTSAFYNPIDFAANVGATVLVP